MQKSEPSARVVYLCLDPGTLKTGWVVLTDQRELLAAGKSMNDLVLGWCRDKRVETDWRKARVSIDVDRMVCEFPEHIGQRAGSSVFETAFIAGRFVEAFGFADRIARTAVKRYLCPSLVRRAKDKDVRAALIRLWGGEANAIGRTPKGKNDPSRPGPLYGVAADAWAALGVGVTHLAGL